MKRATACWAIAGLLVSLCTLFVLRYGTTHGPAVLVDSGSVAEAADQVMACAASGDYEALVVSGDIFPTTMFSGGFSAATF